MKHRLRRLATLLLACLLACALPCAAFAESGSLTLTVQVPEKHTLTVQADHAEVLYDGTAGTSFLLVRQEDATLLLRPESDWRISQVLYNGADVTAQLNGGYLTLPPITADGTLQVATAPAPVPPTQAAKRYTVRGQVTRDGQPVPGVTLELRSTLKTTVTDGNGAFRFDEVETGWHTLTALENGVAIGYAEFELTEGATTNFAQNTDGSLTVNVQADKSELQMQLALVDKTLVLQALTATGPAEAGSGEATASATGSTQGAQLPATGDDAPLLLYLLLLFGAACGLLCLSFYRKRFDHAGEAAPRDAAR